MLLTTVEVRVATRALGVAIRYALMAKAVVGATPVLPFPITPVVVSPSCELSSTVVVGVAPALPSDVDLVGA